MEFRRLPPQEWPNAGAIEFQPTRAALPLLSADDVSGMRTGILYLTLLNETRSLVSHAFALIRRIKELYES